MCMYIQHNRTQYKATPTHNGLVIVSCGGADTHGHAHFALSIEVVLEQVGQLGVPVGDNLGGSAGLVVTESLHACSEHHEVGIDVVGLPEAISRAVGSSGPLAACQVNQGQLGDGQKTLVL